MKTVNEQLYGEHIPQRTALENQQKEEIALLRKRHASEKLKLGVTAELKDKQNQEERELLKKHSQQGQELLDRQEREFEKLLEDREKLKPTELETILQERRALNARYREENEKSREAAEAYRRQNESLLEKMKRQWSKNHNLEQDH